MILKKEIEKIALHENVSRSTVDKDWVLGHFIDAIFSIPLCQDSLVFKGGSCLKKCYIPDYRFSEDLDFTSIDKDFIIKFWGSDHPRNDSLPPPQRWQTKVKIEIILYELKLFPVSKRDVVHSYSDKLTDNTLKVPCYSIEEVLAEKMRSLIQWP